MAIDGISSIGKSGTNPTSAAEKPTKKPGRELMNSFLHFIGLLRFT